MTSDIADYVDGVCAGHRPTLARAITLVESRRPEHVERAQRLLAALLEHSGGAHRVGITGVPGAGKSTFIDTLGTRLTNQGHRVAVLAVDPSSSRSGGSILGDRTRMPSLSADPNAFVRPSPTSGTLGGVARGSREAIVLMEAAGFDVVLVETVGVGQSEVAVAAMVDCFCLLTLARTGDELQGIKKGVLELVDVVAVNKADGEHAADARRAASELSRALRLLQPVNASWRPPVLTCSGLTGDRLDEVWQAVLDHHSALRETGELTQRRAAQQVDWMWTQVREQLMGRLLGDRRVDEVAAEVEGAVRSGELPATLAAERLLRAFMRQDPAGHDVMPPPEHPRSAESRSDNSPGQ